MEMLKKVNVAYTLVFGLAIHAMLPIESTVHPLSVAFLTVPLLAYEGYKLFLSHKKPDPVKINEEIQKEIDAIKSKLNILTLEKTVNTKQPQRYF